MLTGNEKIFPYTNNFPITKENLSHHDGISPPMIWSSKYAQNQTSKLYIFVVIFDLKSLEVLGVPYKRRYWEKSKISLT